MKFTFRSRLFLYLLLLLALFVVSQAGIYVYVEWAHRSANPRETMEEGWTEVADAMELTLLLVPMLVAAAWLISRWMIRPLRVMAATAGRIRHGRWTERIETASMPDDETRSLAETVNAAFDGYAAVLGRLERFSGDAAHQLRTPIAAMRSLGEVALSRAREAAEYREALVTMLAELDRLTRIVEQLLQLSRLESGALRERFLPVALEATVAQVQHIYQPLAEARGVTLAAEVSPRALYVDGIEELLVELLGNLVDNALRHTPAGGSIRIQGTAAPDRNTVCLAVTDDGPGIPREFARRIFDRFTRIPGAESGKAGLGLALASEIAAVHGGRLTLTNPGQPGARFECRLPTSAGLR